MLYFYTGGAGGGKSFALIQKIKELSDGHNKICVIVPEQYSYEFEKNLYHAAGVSKFNNIDTFSFTTLSRDIIKAYGDKRILKEYADENKRTIIMNLALNEVYSSLPNNVGFYSRQYKKNGFTEEMTNFITEIKQAGISAEVLRKTKEKFNGRLHEKMQDIYEIYNSYDKLMSDFGFRDRLNDIVEAAHIAAEKRYFKNKIVIIDEFDDFNGDQYEMLKAISSDANDIYIGLRTDNINAPEFTLFDTVNNTYRKIADMCGKHEVRIFDFGKRFQSHGDLIFLNKNIFRNTAKKTDIKADNISIFEARDFYSEIEYVCAEIKHIVYNDSSVKYNDIAVISTSISDYAPIIENTFRRYDIPCFMSIEKDVSHTVTMIYICSLLDIISSDTYNTETILKYLKTGLAGIDLIEISNLENFCYEWSINGKSWKKSFIPENVNSDLDSFIGFEELRKKIIPPLENLKASVKNTTADVICKNIYSFIKNTGADEKIKEFIGFYNDKNEIYLANEQKKIWDFLVTIIDDLYSTLYGKEITIKQYGSLFRQLLNQAKYSVPPETLDSVTAASSLTARLNSPKIVFILGVNEGKFPALPSSDRLFSNDEREKLALNGFNKNKTAINIIANSRLSSYKALSSASEKLYISYSLTSPEGNSLYRSSVIDDIEKMFPLNKNLIIHESEISEDYYAVNLKSAYYHLMQNKKNANSEVNTIKAILEENEEYAEKIKYVYQVSPLGKNYELSDRKILDKLVDFGNFKLSNTKFETYSKCHFRYFCKYCLNLKQRNKIEMNVMNWGILRHNCFHALLSNKNPVFIDMTDEQITAVITDECEKYKNQTFKNSFKEDDRTDFLFRKIVNQIKLAALYLQSELKNTDFVPAALEANLTKNDDFSPLVIPTETGNIIFEGTIDRIDTYENYIRIIDYKTSEKKIEKFFIDNGMDMQLMLYMLAVTQNGKFKDYIPAGMLYASLTVDYETEPRDKNADKSRMENIMSKFKFNGIALDENNVLNSMDKSTEKNYIKIKRKSASSPVLPFSEEQIKKLLEFSENKLKSMKESLYNGDISIDPFKPPKPKENVCEYCEFANICGNFPVTLKSHGEKNKDTSDAINAIFPEIEKNNKKEK